MGDGTGSYRLDELGWLQFERLCALLEAGEEEIRWHGEADRVRWAATTETVRVVAWMHAGVPAERRPHELARRVRRCVELAGPPAGRDLVVMTNMDAAAARAEVGGGTARTTVLGAAEIGALLDERAALRAAVPCVLGLRDLAPLIDPGARARSSLDLERAQALARVFVPTGAHARARAVLGRHRFVVLTGPPEMGKTAIAQMVALAALTDGWEAHDCTAPEEVWEALAPDRAQVFVADDAFGSTEFRPDAAERWARELPRLLRSLDERHWLVWTSRPAPLRAGLRRLQRERGAERFPAPGEVLVDASRLDLAEKALILFRHAKSRAPAGEVCAALREAGLSIVEHPHFTPERIRRFAAGRLGDLPAALEGGGLQAAVERELATPTEAMATSFRALGAEHRALLTALLDAPDGLVDARELAAAVRRHHPGGLSRPPAELIDRLTDHFLRTTPLGIGWVHPSWRDLVIEELSGDADARQRFLGACGVPGALLVLSHGGGAGGERALPLLLADADWDRFGDRLHRLLRELPDREAGQLLLAVADALQAELEPARQAELRSLGRSLADAARRLWDRRNRPLGLFPLESWLLLARRTGGAVEPPALGVTWVELHPGSSAVGLDQAALARADDWLALAEALDVHAPRALHELGFPWREEMTLDRLAHGAAQAAEDPELRPLAQRVLARVGRLAPDAAEPLLALDPTPEQDDRWWTPHDLPQPPSAEPAARRPGGFTAAHVDRVLRDL